MSFKVTKNNTIYLTRGDTFKAVLTITNPDGTEYTPVEGETVRFALKEDVYDDKCLILKEIPLDTMILIINPEETKELDFGEYVYDIQITRNNGDVDTFITASKLKLTAEVE